jgi:hypothetical protein
MVNTLKADNLLSLIIMGAIEQSSAIYLTIADGKICRRMTQKTDKSVERTTKDGKVVHEEFYRGWSGLITDIKTRENEYGKSWMVHLADQNGKYILQMPYSSGYSSAFLKALPNVNVKEIISIVPNLTIDGDKKKTTLFISQKQLPIKWAYTRDNPNGIPNMQQIKVKGKMAWDDSEMMEFLENMVNNEILPKLKGNDEAEFEELPF